MLPSPHASGSAAVGCCPKHRQVPPGVWCAARRRGRRRQIVDGQLVSVTTNSCPTPVYTGCSWRYAKGIKPSGYSKRSKLKIVGNWQPLEVRLHQRTSPPGLPTEEIVSRFPHRWVLVAAIVCDRQASGVSPLVFEAILPYDQLP